MKSKLIRKKLETSWRYEIEKVNDGRFGQYVGIYAVLQTFWKTNRRPFYWKIVLLSHLVIVHNIFHDLCCPLPLDAWLVWHNSIIVFHHLFSKHVYAPPLLYFCPMESFYVLSAGFLFLDACMGYQCAPTYGRENAMLNQNFRPVNEM